jgi:hypothetical protein
MLAMRVSVLIMIVIVLTTANPARAEVCDKAVEAASSAWVVALPFYILLFLIMWQAWSRRSRILHILAATLTGLPVALVMYEWWQGGYVHELAIAEGCRHFPYVSMTILGLLCVWSLWHVFIPLSGAKRPQLSPDIAADSE